jgi:hypothetical protein
MTDEPRDLQVENALLRGSLYLTARALRDYLDARHTRVEHDGRPMLQLTVPESIQTKAALELAKAQQMLQDEGRGR